MCYYETGDLVMLMDDRGTPGQAGDIFEVEASTQKLTYSERFGFRTKPSSLKLRRRRGCEPEMTKSNVLWKVERFVPLD